MNRRWLAGLVIAGVLLGAVAIAPPEAEAQGLRWWLQLAEGDDPAKGITDRARCRVMTINTTTQTLTFNNGVMTG